MFLAVSGIDIIVNIISGIAMLIFIIASFLKSKNKILSWQCVAHSMFVVIEIITKAWSSIVQETIGITRNLLTLTKKNSKVISIILIVIGAVFGIVVNIIFKEEGMPWYGSWVGYLPVIANLEYSIVVLRKKSGVKAIKMSFAISSVLWGINFWFLGVYVSAIMNFICAVTSIYSFFKLIRVKEEAIEK